MRRYRRFLPFILIAAMMLYLFSGCFKIERTALDDSDKEWPDISLPAVSPSDPVITEKPQETPLTGVAADRRDPFTHLFGNGTDNITVMIYICASDLESGYGCATTDIIEMLEAKSSDKLSIILQTGGTKSWQNDTISNTHSQRFRVAEDELELIDDSLGKLDMTEPENLGDFISFCAEEYPANRNIMILWDHGGGTLSGYGYDEVYDYSNGDSMTLDEIQYALDIGGVLFEIIGFDACLMSTVETAYALSDYADYMLASQKTEPGCGWFYTGFLTELAKNTSLPAQELAKRIADDFVGQSALEDYSSETTLALVDLMQMGSLIKALREYFSQADTQLKDGGFADVSRARAESGASRALYSDYDHVDLVSLAQNLQNDASGELIKAVEESVVYFNYFNTTDVNGISIYFPYTNLSYTDRMMRLYNAIGFDKEYVNFITGFISVMLGGQIDGENDQLQTEDWYDQELVNNYEIYYNDESSVYNELEVEEKGDNYVLSLTQKEWDSVVGIQMQVYLDDGEGFIDLGSDNMYEFDDDGDLLITFDNTWVSVNGQTVCFYAEYEAETAEGFWYTYGSAAALVNGRYADIIIMWDDNNPYGYVAGARYDYEGTLSQKGYAPLNDGDEIQFLCDYYTYDGEFDDVYNFNDPIVVYGAMTVGYEDIGLGDCYVFYQLTDIYGNHYWAEPVLFYD